MTFKEISQMIAGFGYPYAYYQFPDNTGQAPPFICFWYDYRDFYSDDVNYKKRVVLNIEFYTDEKDIEAEEGIEGSIPFSYSKSSVYIDTEKMWETTYTMEILIDNTTTEVIS